LSFFLLIKIYIFTKFFSFSKKKKKKKKNLQRMNTKRS
jgi:hypothetical protein